MELQDETNFTSSSSHRLPTVSASEALHQLSSARDQYLSTGVSQLDAALRGTTASPPESAHKELSGGFQRGQVTEIYGPPGAGKRALLLQAAARALHAGDSVVWIDTTHKLFGARLADVLNHCQPPNSPDLHSSPPVVRLTGELSEKFHHFWTPTLPHLLALLCHTSPNFPPKATSLIVIDTIPTLFGASLSRASEDNDANQKPTVKSEAAQWAASRRWSAMGEFATKVSRLAALKHLAVVVSSQTNTKIKMERSAVLRPSIMTKAWVEAINTRIVVFRDFSIPYHQKLHQSSGSGIRFAGLVKMGSVMFDHLDQVVPFTIDKSGIHEMAVAPGPIQHSALPLLMSSPLLKRKRELIADSESEGEEFGPVEVIWVEEDPLTPEEVLAEDKSDVQVPEVGSGQERAFVTSYGREENMEAILLPEE